MSKKVPLFLLAVIILLVTFSKLGILTTKIVQIDLGNAECINELQVKEALQLERTNILLIGDSQKKDLLVKYPCVEEVRFERQLPNSVKVQLINRKPFASFMHYQEAENLDLFQAEASPSSSSALINWEIEPSTGAKFIGDQFGVLFREKDDNSLPQILVEDDLKVGFKFNYENFQNLKQILEALSGEYQGISGKIAGENLMIKTPQKLVFSLKKDVNRQLASLQLILQKAKINGESMEIIDLRFDKPIVIYNPKK